MLNRRLPVVCLPVVASLLLFAAAFSQTPPPRPAYDVAAIKPNNSGSGNSSTHGSEGQITFTNQSLRRYIERAWNVKTFQVVGPDWLDNLAFDIVAKYPPDTKPEDRNIMLQTLLADRFKLAIHHESKDLPGYALMVAKGGLKLQPADGTGGTNSNSNGSRIRTLKATNMSMSSLADFLGRQLNQSVVDKTSAPGVYNLELRWMLDDQTGTADPASNVATETAPSLFTAIQEALGLRLQAEKVPVDMIVVDHIEREPTEN